MFFLNTFQVYLLYVTDSLITTIVIQRLDSLHTMLGKQWVDLAISFTSFITVAKIYTRSPALQLVLSSSIN